MISVIVTLRDSAQSVISTLQSIVAQTAQQWECVIIDNASTDESEFMVRSYLIDRRMRYFRLASRVSTAEAREIGLRETRGDYIMYLDAADYLESNALQALYLTIKKYGADIAAANFATEHAGERRPWSYLREGLYHPGQVLLTTANTLMARRLAETPEAWRQKDVAFSDHLISIWGEREEPLAAEVEPKWLQFIKKIFKRK